MARYGKGDYVKFEVTDEQSCDTEWIWLLVDDSSDEQRVVFGQLDSEPVVATGMKRAPQPSIRHSFQACHILRDSHASS